MVGSNQSYTKVVFNFTLFLSHTTFPPVNSILFSFIFKSYTNRFRATHVSVHGDIHSQQTHFVYGCIIDMFIWEDALLHHCA